MLPVPTVNDLVAFTGQSEDSFTSYAQEALAQATLLFGVKTKRTDLPDDPDLAQLAINGILQMAERIIYEQPYAQLTASPLQSETIGSYSYSKLSQLNSGRFGVKSLADTGLFWWDLAVEELTLDERSLVMSGSVEVMEMDLYRSPEDGTLFLRGPADYLPPDLPYDVNAETPGPYHR